MPDEIQTEEIIKDIFKQGKECFIPRYKPHSNHMDMLKLSSAEDISSLPLTSWNIHQPSDDDNVREEALSGGWRFCNPVFWGPMKTHVKKGKIRTIFEALSSATGLTSASSSSLSPRKGRLGQVLTTLPG
nr:PREDICTED: 5-formyltetrahydrofolate cyclo-ligase isoform X3 [Apteryx mantelli mantelli]